MYNKRYIEDNEENQDEEIDIIELVMIVRRYIVLIISIVFVSMLAGGIFALTRQLVYKSSTKLIVSSGNYYSEKNLEVAEITKNQQLVATYITIAKSSTVLNKIIKKLDLDISAVELEKKINFKAVPSTEIIEIFSTDKNPNVAMKIANEAAIEFMLKGKEVMTFLNIRVIEEAEVPKVPESRKRALIIFISGILGISLSLGLVILIELLYSKIKNPKDIKKIFGVDILACIPLYEQIGEIRELHKKNLINKIIEKIKKIEGIIKKVGEKKK
ncbi:MAG: YveK family protein [Fusobacteriaceae bacterium]